MNPELDLATAWPWLLACVVALFCIPLSFRYSQKEIHGKAITIVVSVIVLAIILFGPGPL